MFVIRDEPATGRPGFRRVNRVYGRCEVVRGGEPWLRWCQYKGLVEEPYCRRELDGLRALNDVFNAVRADPSRLKERMLSGYYKALTVNRYTYGPYAEAYHALRRA